MKYLFFIILSVLNIGSVYATTPPGLYDGQNPPPTSRGGQGNPPAPGQQGTKERQQGVGQQKAPPVKEPAIPKGIIIKNTKDTPRIITDENSPIITNTKKDLKDDSIISGLGSLFDNELIDKVTNLLPLGKKEEKEVKPVQNVEKKEEKEEVSPPSISVKSIEIKAIEKDFIIPDTISKRNLDDRDFVKIILENLSNIKPTDLALEKIKKEEEEKRLALELEKQQKEEEERKILDEKQRIVEAEGKLLREEKRKQDATQKRKTKRELLVEKVREFSVGGFKLGTTPDEISEIAKQNDFKIKFVSKKIPETLEWKYEQLCHKEKIYSPQMISSCVTDKAVLDNAEYVSTMLLVSNDESENLKLSFSSNFSKNALFRVEYKSLGDKSLGSSEKSGFLREQRKLDFLRRVRKRYGNPDDPRNLVWGSSRDGVTLTASISSFDIDGNIIMEDITSEGKEASLIRRASNKVPRDNNFSF